MRRFAPFALVLALGSGCARRDPPTGDPPPSEAPGARARSAAEPAPRSGDERRAPVSGAAATRGATTSAEPELRRGVRWYDDAPEAALAAARAAGKPLLVDLWAPWCHTCLSMQTFVLTSEALGNVTDRFVWLAIDTERAENAAFLERLPVGVWPTFYVVDADLKVLGRWLGAASPAQLVRFLAESERAGALARDPTRSPNDPLTQLVLADERATRGDHEAAARLYARALELAPPEWPRRPETLVALITALRKSEQIDACLELAERSLAQTGVAASAIDFTSHALSCVDRAANGASSAERVRRAAAAWLEPLCQRGSSELTPDDRADGCSQLARARESLGEAAGADAARRARLAVLERAVTGKPLEIVATYDWAFTDTLIELGRAEEALERSQQRERERPHDYNPPQHQARAYKALGRHAEGLAAIDRAIALAYGPRKVGFLTLKADLLLGAGRKAEALEVVRQQLADYRALPASQRQPAAEARVEQRLREWR